MTLELNEMLRLLAPLIVLNYAMVFFCLFLIWKKGTENFNQLIWTLIVLFVYLFGPIAFLVFGRKKTHD